MLYALVLLLGLVAGTVSGVVGTGSSLILMPALVALFGPQHAVPVMAIASVFGNAGKVLAWWRGVEWSACLAFGAAAVPGAVLGVHTLLALPAAAVESVLGLFFIAMVPARRLMGRRQWRLSTAQLALVAAPLGFLTGIVVSTGPITIPVFLARGLEGGALIGTEAAASIAMYAAKVATFRAQDALPPAIVLHGLAVGASLLGGGFVARRFILAMPAHAHRLLIDGMMLACGATLLAMATMSAR